MKNFKIVRSEKFRTPLSAEKKIGLWVDRIGEGTDKKTSVENLRILGLFAAVYVEKGNGSFYSKESGEIKLEPGDTILLFPDVPHIYQPDGEWQTRWIVWNGPESENLAKMAFFRKHTPVIKANRKAVPYAHKLIGDIIRDEDMGSIFERKNIIMNMLFSLYKTLHNEENSPRASLMGKMIGLMKESYDKDISVKELASYAGLSETHFRRTFKEHTGRSPKDFMISLRISKAKECFSRGFSIKETSELSGFKDMFYFMRLFKKITGCTAGKYVS